MTRSRDPRTGTGKGRAAAPPAGGRGNAARRPAPASGPAAAHARAGSATAVARKGNAPAKARAGGKKAPAAKRVTKNPAQKPRTTTARRPAARKATARTPTGRKPAARRPPAPRPKPLRVAPVRKPRVQRAASPHRRLVALLVIMAVAFAAIAVRLFDVQAVEGRRYEAMAMAQRVHSVDLPAQRGSIFDRDGNQLALSVPQQTVYADPRVVKDPDRYARKLAPIVDVNQKDLRERLSQKRLAFVYVARTVSDEKAAKIKKLDLPGLGFIPESKRFYPAGSLAGPVLGFNGTDNKGLSGFEMKYNGLLHGKNGKLVAEEDPNGREIPATQRTAEAAQRGGDLVLTVDESLQYEVEKQLLAQVKAVSARGGIAIVSDVQTGDVLAMASVTGARNGSPAQLTPAAASNPALASIYEPGSTAKVITVSAALETKAIQPDSTFYVEPKLKIADKWFQDAEYHKPQVWNVGEIIRQSSNIGVIHIAEKLGKERLNLYQHAFGFGRKTPIDFPYESAGLMKEPSQYVATDMGSIPIGYTTAVTPMQMLDVFTTIANRGVSSPPRLVAATIDANGERHDLPAPKGHRVVSEQTAAEMNLMMRGVVSKGGTGEQAAVPGYTVAGKTGTSRKPPYEPTPRYMASFAGFAPAENPRLAAIVVIDQPGATNESYYGGKVAAPLFASIMKYALRLESVPPSGLFATAATAPGPVAPRPPKPATPPPSTPAPTTPATPPPSVPTPAPATAPPAGIAMGAPPDPAASGAGR